MNGKQWYHKGCSTAKPTCKSGTCTACASDTDCSSIQSVDSAPSTLKCHGSTAATNGKASTLGPGGCAVCRNNMLGEPSGVIHSGCSSTNPVCKVTSSGDGVCSKCTATSVATSSVNADDTCGGSTVLGTSGYKTLGQCSATTNGVCQCRDVTSSSDTNPSVLVGTPDKGCPSIMPSCKSNACACGGTSSATGTTCTITQTCSISSGVGTCS